MHKGISFPEAVVELAGRYGIDLPRPEPGRNYRPGPSKTGLYKAVDLARKFYEDELQAESSGRRAREYLADRGLKPDLIREFHLGWAPPGWDNLRRFLESHRAPTEIMEKAGLIKPRNEGRGYYDTFRARIICPIFGLDGQTVAFGGRLLEDEKNQPKYLNSPDTPIYTKGRLLYGFDRARAKIKELRSVLIVEGYFDLLSLVANNVRHVAATLGTALTADHLRLLKGYVDQAVLVFDADEAGRAAAARALPLFISADLEGRVLSLPDGHDPDTFVREYGPEALEDAVKSASNLLDFYMEMTLARYPDNLSGKSRAAQEVLGVISRVESRTRRDLIRRALSERLGISEEALLLSEKRNNRERFNTNEQIQRVTADFETETLKLMLLHPETAADLIAADLGSLFQNQTARKVYLAMTSQFGRTSTVDPDRLIEALEVEEAGLVTGLASSDDGMSGEDMTGAVADFLQKFSQRRLRQKAVDLSKRIKKAQASEDQTGLIQLLQEKNQLLKEINT
jgi:DNA primase